MHSALFDELEVIQMYFIAAVSWRWQQERGSLRDAP